MDNKASMRVYAIVLMLMISITGAAMAPFLAAAIYQQPDSSNDGSVDLANGQSGTTLSAMKTADGFWEINGEYNWTITKTVEPNNAIVEVGDTATFTYTLVMDRTEMVDQERYVVRGTIRVMNGGDVATENLKIIDTVQMKGAGSDWTTITSVEIDLGDFAVLPPCGEHTYTYEIVLPEGFVPADGSDFRNCAKVTITNHSGALGEEKGPGDEMGVKDSFIFPAMPIEAEFLDATAFIDDVMGELPTGFELVGDVPDHWDVIAPGMITFDVTVMNVGNELNQASDVVNTVTLTEGDSMEERTDSAVITLTGVADEFEEPNPRIEVAKIGPMAACQGEIIEYTIWVNNTGDVNLTNILVKDPMIGFEDTIDLLAGEQMIYHLAFTMPLDIEGNYFTNTVTANFSIPGVLEFAEQDSWTLFVNHPGLMVEKWGPSEPASPGDWIAYDVYINNTGNCDLTGVLLEDIVLGYSDTVDIMTGGSVYLHLDYQIPADYQSTELVNVFSATIMVCDHEVTASDSWSVEIIQLPGTPCISIEKQGPCAAMLGEEVPFMITVTNTGNVPLSNVYVWDEWMDETYYLADDVMEEDNILDPNEVWSFTVYAIVVNNYMDDFVNVAEVYGTWEGMNVWCQDSFAVEIISPAISVVKTGPEVSAVGHELTWTIVVSNIGDVDLTNVAWIDVASYGEGVWSETSSGDIGYLPVGGSETFTVTITVPEMAGYDNICNHIDVKGQPGPSDLWCGCGGCPWFEETNERRWVMDSDEVCTFIMQPSIDVEKYGPRCAAEGETIYYNIVVTNTGNVDLNMVDVWDNMTGDHWVIEYLPIGGTWAPDVEPMFEVSDPYMNDWIYNTVDVRAEVIEDHCYVSDSDTVNTFVSKPDIMLEKVGAWSGPMEGNPFGTIHYTITMTNTGNGVLTDVTLTDYLPDGTNFTVILEDLDVGEVLVYEFDFVVMEAYAGSITNTAVVEAISDDCCMIVVIAQDSEFTLVAMPSVELTKYITQEYAMIGDELIWYIEVLNTGNVPLENLIVTDSLDPMWSYTIDMLDVAETAYIEFPYMVTESSPWNETYSLCNWAYVNGDYFGIPLYDEDKACIPVILPSLDITKVGPEHVCFGEVVVWDIMVYNTGNVDLYNVDVSDPLTGQNWNDLEIPVGGNIHLTASYDTGSHEFSGWLENIVYVTAEFADDRAALSDSATARTFVVLVDIDVDKVGPEFAVRGETITYTITVYNNGNIDVSVHVVDEMLGYDESVFVIAGENEVIEIEYTIDECYEGATLFNTVIVDAMSQCGCQDEASDCWELDILCLGISIVKVGPEYAAPGDLISFTFTVTNVGEVDLTNVYVWDPLTGITYYLADDSAEEDDILMVGETWTFTDIDCYQIPADFLETNPNGELTNWAYVYGEYNGVSTMWKDGWAIWVTEDGCCPVDA